MKIETTYIIRKGTEIHATFLNVDNALKVWDDLQHNEGKTYEHCNVNMNMTQPVFPSGTMMMYDGGVISSKRYETYRFDTIIEITDPESDE